MEEMNSLIKEISLVFECIKAAKVLIREKTKYILLIDAFLII